MAYCARCRMGTIDAQGLCTLCGAPQEPPSRAARLAEAGDTLLSGLLQPAVLLVVGLAALLLLTALVSAAGARPPAGLPGAGATAFLNPEATLAAARQDPVGALIRFLLPALFQAVLFGLLLLGLILFLRRRRPDSAPRERRLAGE